MKIKRLVIENFKSIERIELIEPNPFTVFVGPNGAGKSNIFEALEFVALNYQLGPQGALSVMGGWDSIQNRQNSNQFNAVMDSSDFTLIIDPAKAQKMGLLHFGFFAPSGKVISPRDSPDYMQFIEAFARVFVRNEELVKVVLNDNQRLSLSAGNLEKVLKRILANDVLKNEIFEWLELFVPEFKGIEVMSNPFDGKEALLWYEQFSEKPFTKELISDGTYNILALLTAVYQSDDKPQFLCIEEPENGLHPQVAGELIDFFRTMCEERGHYIWLNTHSQTMASRVRPEELVVVDKKHGSTRIRQFKSDDLSGWRMDEAWLTNALGGGLPW